MIERRHIERYSGVVNLKGIPALKRKNYYLVNDFSVMGDAPKDLIRIYEYHKSNRYKKIQHELWPLYIAKVGHKWYPSESITEYLLYRLGVTFGIKMAEGSLAIINNQLRFLSKYFIRSRDEQLIHGADIFAGYIGDKDLVEQIEQQRMSREMFTFQFVEEAIDYQFASERRSIMRAFIRMLLFDCLVGNNDRHFYNWAIIRDIRNLHHPCFSPVYDTARGLFWNNSDSQLIAFLKDNPELRIKKYCDNSRPKIGWEGIRSLNHFKLFEKLYECQSYLSREEIKALFLQDIFDKMIRVVETEFNGLFTGERIEAIKLCLCYRYDRMKEILK